VSIVDLYTHEQEVLRGVVLEVPLSVPETNGKVALGDVLPPTLLLLLSLTPPSSVLRMMAMTPLAGLPLECPDLFPRVLPLVVFELPISLHFPLASCIII
jgi:hypothetical protein